jgi:hypothetical protein
MHFGDTLLIHALYPKYHTIPGHIDFSLLWEMIEKPGQITTDGIIIF